MNDYSIYLSLNLSAKLNADIFHFISYLLHSNVQHSSRFARLVTFSASLRKKNAKDHRNIEVQNEVFLRDLCYKLTNYPS